MKRYAEYKDSGTAWIGEIPANWKLKKLKYYTTVNDEVLSERTPAEYEFRYVDIGSVTLENGIEQYQEMLFENAPSRARRIVRKGDVIVSTVRTYLKAVASIQDDDDVIVSTGFAVIRSNKVDPRFMAYSLINHYFVEKVSSLSTGVSYEWKVKNMRTKWGTCNIDRKRIWINLQLAKKTPECLAYVVTHELVHLLERNHNEQFQKYMDTFFPEWRVVKETLNQQMLDYMSE